MNSLLRQTLFAALLLNLSFCTLCYGQEPVLIQDYNTGEEDALDDFSPVGLKLGDRIITALTNTEHGREPVVLRNGQASLIIDIFPGADGSDPDDFTHFQDRVAFIATGNAEGGSVWLSDGTSDGTSLVFSQDDGSTSRPDGLIRGKDDRLYFTYRASLYAYDGEATKLISTNATFNRATQQASDNYTSYGESIAWLQFASGTVSVYTVQGDSAVFLGGIDGISSFDDFYGISEVDGGLVFTIEGRDDLGYFYDAQDETIGTFDIAGGHARRMYPINGESALALVGGQGYFAVNGIESEELSLYSSSNNTLTQGDPIDHITYEDDKLLFIGRESGTFGDDKLIFSNLTTGESSELLTLRTHHSEIVRSGEYAFLANGTSNGFRPEFYYVDLNTQETSLFYSFEDRSEETNSVKPIGVVGDTLYYMSNLDLTVGREPYYIVLDVMPTSTADLPSKNVSIDLFDRQYIINTEQDQEILLQYFTLDGRLIQNRRGITNQLNSLPNVTQGQIILRASNQEWAISRLIPLR